jgi:hypothetical protein
VSVVATHTCGATTYLLLDETGVQRRLDTVDSWSGTWVIQPDGRSCRTLTGAEIRAGHRGHHPHECAPGTDRQPTLFEAAP